MDKQKGNFKFPSFVNCIVMFPPRLNTTPNTHSHTNTHTPSSNIENLSEEYGRKLLRCEAAGIYIKFFLLTIVAFKKILGSFSIHKTYLIDLRTLLYALATYLFIP